jgi:enoyl-CoA hydratase
VVPQEEVLPKAIELLQTITGKAPLALSKCIAAVNAVYNDGVNGYEMELNAFGACFETEDMKEGAAAFLEKRNPNFKAR